MIIKIIIFKLLFSDFEPYVSQARGTPAEIKTALKYFCTLPETFQKAFLESEKLIGVASYEYFHLAYGIECSDMTQILALPTQTGK